MSEPTVRRRRLGGELRRMRETKGLKVSDVARTTPLNDPKISRIENATVGVKPADLDALLDLYGVDDAEKRAALHRLAREGSKRGWWYTYRDAISPAYADLISLEADAKSMRSYQSTLIPGLLQTAAYARATIDAINMTSAGEHVDALVQVRVARQAVLTRPDPLEVWAIIHEAAIRPQVSNNPQVMRDQLQHLLDLSDMHHVSIQVLPLSAPPHPGMAGSFAVVGFPETADLDVVLVESLASSLYVEDPTEVARYGSAFERLRAAALPFDQSADLISNVKKDVTK
ncbi:helix-turn-helix domain-containing protein [Streptomyces chryseus]|uniref:helix-turn-helix domain-containing protein n=1 Tax=Streptomyces chryseus TaxID=68186 RepID=UPI00110F8BB3|nr:helix-turn-helix transcriptional regulator [Streptomyces chryseus]GGX26543.1 transcriptional regulator [Streptomyces chryseus]